MCGKTFKTRDYLRDHVFKVHKKKLKDLAPNSITSDEEITGVNWRYFNFNEYINLLPGILFWS